MYSHNPQNIRRYEKNTECKQPGTPADFLFCLYTTLLFVGWHDAFISFPREGERELFKEFKEFLICAVNAS
jgi:hypothetical protein